MSMRTLVVLWGGGLILILAACTENPERVNDQEVFASGDPELAKGPDFKQSQFKVYTLYKPQVQHRNFNGIFDIGPRTARVVRSFWKERFNELTRTDYYGEFFLEFYDYMGSFAQAYPVDTRAKERMLGSLEKSFHTLCLVLGIGEAFAKFQQDQQRIHGD